MGRKELMGQSPRERDCGEKAECRVPSNWCWVRGVTGVCDGNWDGRLGVCRVGSAALLEP